MSAHLKTLTAHAKVALKPARQGQLSPSERIALFRRFLKIEEHRIRLRHRAGAGGLEIARDRSELLDVVLRAVFESAMKKRGDRNDIALVAVGGYGRATLNPRSDIDLLLLLPRASTKLPADLKELVTEIVNLLWDVGFKVGSVCRSIAECIRQARLDQEDKTSMMDARFIAGDRALFNKFLAGFEKAAIAKGQKAFFELRRNDLRNRHDKHLRTVFLQEPHVKEGCGGMRDYQSICWVARVKRGCRDLRELVEARVLTRTAHREIEEAYDFLHRVRNELHYETGQATDQLTLRLQGVVATNFRYPQRSILRRTEAFMRDYYRHTRNLHQRTGSLMEIFEIEEQDAREKGLVPFLTLGRRKREEFDGFVALEGRIEPANSGIFKEDPNRLMRLFQHAQVRNLRLGPAMRKLVKKHWGDIDRPFRYSKANRELFEQMLQRKGQVGSTLRRMHRAGVLGRYLPEFGALDCLVQHEFFHRYTADEHTLRFIETIDSLVNNDEPAVRHFAELMRRIEDPYIFYLAILLHDTGRSENVREHIDGSAVLAQRLCNRLQVRGRRRQMIMFLVDHHLTFWRYATTKNIDDPKVVAKFAGLMKTVDRLDALMLFTYGDSVATSPDSWNGWKESLLRQLHRSARHFLEEGEEQFNARLAAERSELGNEVVSGMGDDWRDEIREHFERMPASYFRFRDAKTVPGHLKAVREFRRREGEGGFVCVGRSFDYPERGYSEVVIVSRDRPHFLQKVCCAFASQEINILSADFHTRTDGIVVDLFRVCTIDFGAVTDERQREGFTTTLRTLGDAESYDPADYLKRKKNLLRKETRSDIAFPVRAHVHNSASSGATIIEIQAVDRIGLLHDLFLAINQAGLDTVHARISTEKGAAVDTLYVTLPGGGQATDPGQLEALQLGLEQAISAR
jgi:[protein-PII] uridylyltransferase